MLDMLARTNSVLLAVRRRALIGACILLALLLVQVDCATAVLCCLKEWENKARLLKTEGKGSFRQVMEQDVIQEGALRGQEGANGAD